MIVWYLKKLNELIQVTRYCNHPLIEAHMVLAHSATQDSLGDGPLVPNQALERVIRLSAQQALRDGREETAAKLLAVAEGLLSEKGASENVVAVDFENCNRSTA